MSLSSGETLQGRYRIEDLLGQGGMGAVYRATDLRFDTLVAIKENLVTTPEDQAQFAQEAELLYRLRHPNLPRVIDHFSLPDHGQYLVMDLVEGEDLNDILDRQRWMPERVALGWMWQVLDALQYLHGQGIIHRDVKPGNVRIAPDGRAVLVDFGVAKVHVPGQETVLAARYVTPGYSPPEQYGQGGTDARSDVYAAGATLYNLLTGECPPEATAILAMQVRLVRPRRINPRVSPGVEAAILKAMAPEAPNRYQSAAAFRQALLAPEEVQTVPAALPPGQQGQPRRQIWLVAALVALGTLAMLALLILFGPWRYPRPTPTPSPPPDPGDTIAPEAPWNPSPPDGTRDLALGVTLRWRGGEPGGEAVTYDVYVESGISTPAAAACQGLSTPSCALTDLDHGTNYTWQVVATGERGASTAGPVWRFATAPCLDPPRVPADPSPADGASGLGAGTGLGWSGGHPCPDEAVTYDVYLGAGEGTPGTLVCHDLATPTCNPGTLADNTRYRWRVVARGARGSSEGPVWEFVVGGLCTSPPISPYRPSPRDGASDVSLTAVLDWSGGHLCPGEGVTYDVYLEPGDKTPDTLVCRNASSPSCDPGTLKDGTHYYWRVVARGANGPSDGPVWDFATETVCRQAPDTPSGPSPRDGARDVSTTTRLRWAGGHPCPGELVTYDVYLEAGDKTPDVLVCRDAASPGCDPGSLKDGTRYYWRVVAKGANGPGEGPVWDFTTETVCLQGPNTPSDPAPRDGTGDIALTATLGWSGGHPCPGEPVTYDVYLEAGDNTPGVLVCRNASSPACDPGTLTDGSRYYWQVVAKGANGPSEGPVWDFTTETVCRQGPNTPSQPAPRDGTGDVALTATLGWSGGHPCPGEPVTYDVYLEAGDNTPGVLVCRNAASPACDPGTLTDGSRYFWQVVAKGANGPSEGPVWDFTTETVCQQAPNRPTNPAPRDGTGDVALTATLGWSAGHPCPGEPVTYDVYLEAGDNTPDVLVCRNAAGPACDPGTLTDGSRYYWRVVVKGANGPSEGPVWDFSTETVCRQEPNTPSSPVPGDGATGVDVDAKLSWSGGHPCPGEDVTYDIYLEAGDSTPDIPVCQAVSSLTCVTGGLDYDTDYYWQVVSQGLNGPSTGPVWSLRTAGDPSPPDTPTGVQASDGTYPCRVAITWQAASRATHYEVYKDRRGSPPTVLVGTSTSTGLDDTDVDTTVWYYGVKACNENGCSQISQLDAGSAGYDPDTPSNPSPHDGESDLPLDLVLSWSGGHPCGVLVQYYVYLSAGDSTPGDQVCSTGNSYCSPGPLQPDTLYYWQVRAEVGEGERLGPGPVWTFGTAADGGGNGQPPEPPDSISASDGDFAGRVRVTWDASPGADDYQVWITDGSFPEELLDTTSSTSYTAEDAPGNPTHAYWYAVKACNDAGCSDFGPGVEGGQGDWGYPQ